MSVYRRAISYYRPFARETCTGLLLTLVSIGFGVLKPWPFKIIVDDVLMKTPSHGWLADWLRQLGGPGAIGVLCGMIVLLHLIGGFLNLVTSILFVRIGLQSLLKLRTELYACLHGLPLKFHDARRSADSSFRVAYDSQSIQTIYNKGTGILSSVLTLVCTVAIMLALDWRLTMVALGIIPLIVVAIRVYSEKVRKQSTTIQERESDVLTVVQEGLSSVRMVQAFGREDWEVEQLRRRAHDSLSANLQMTRTSMWSALVIGTLMAAGTAAMSWLGSLHVYHAQLSLGELLVLSSYLGSLYQPIEALTYTVWAMEGATAGAQRCFEVLERDGETQDTPGAKPIDSVRGEVRFEGVKFQYTEDRQILAGVDLVVPAGTQAAFIGGTGAGKSTLLSLVPRFYDPTDGVVRLDGRDLREITKASLRAHISIVLQDTLLFSTTVRENIAYGRPDATEEEIIGAAKRAQAHDFIMTMPAGYDSQVGERGGHLSVGQRQRIGIARAFLKNAPILLLDEPTSALDPTTEAAIMRTLAELMEGRTTLLITHRVATVQDFDQIYVLKHGRIAEQGSASELIARNGEYASLCRAANMLD